MAALSDSRRKLTMVLVLTAIYMVAEVWVAGGLDRWRCLPMLDTC